MLKAIADGVHYAIKYLTQITIGLEMQPIDEFTIVAIIVAAIATAITWFAIVAYRSANSAIPKKRRK